MRAAFIEYFADDGVNFAPDPGNTRARFRARPEAIEPFVLDWHPAIAAVARAGDLGFTTGPYTITGRAPAVREPAQGMFFSVWRRQSDGSWRVIVDGGVPTRAPVPDAAFGDDPQPLISIAKAADAGGQKALFDLEAQPLFGEPAAANGYAALLADEARLVIGPTPPALGRDAIVAQLAERELKFRWETLAAGVSRSDDLGYSYGRLHLLGARAKSAGPLRPRLDARSRRTLAHRRRADAAARSRRLVAASRDRVTSGRRAGVDRSRCARRRR